MSVNDLSEYFFLFDLLESSTESTHRETSVEKKEEKWKNNFLMASVTFYL